MSIRTSQRTSDGRRLWENQDSAFEAQLRQSQLHGIFSGVVKVDGGFALLCDAWLALGH
jgi:hypothetical protein